ncbi:hypothetical protein GXW78_16915 [Roseomonas terrae]|uniref:Terminase n=1 Tax=Neoroseomonas terrae TaxID=424799 RepID=A0ABS5EL75_9PROT|nr:hypothetical protein [Neoroseomonas terrae]MBR0651357.1 hypothetical protein [Neoroseomonas terrae]
MSDAAPILVSPGPIAQAFVDADEPITVLMGPEGSGKTTTGILKGITKSYLWPRTRPGVTSVRFVMIRRLLKDLEATTMKSWLQWFPRTQGTWRGGKGEPATHEIILPHPRGGVVEMTAEFVATGDLRVEEAMRGKEFSFAYVDEVDLAPDDILTWTFGRAGRFPMETLSRNPKWVWGTCNAPQDGNWVIEDFINQVKPGHRMFRQPSGLSPQAENVQNLGRNWYPQLAQNLPAFERKRRIENIPGLSRNKEAIYQEFNPDVHIAAGPLKPLQGRKIIVGADAGGTPGAGFWQLMPDGQWRLYAEISTHAKEHGSVTGPTRFGDAIAALAAERFPNFQLVGIADPSAAYGADTAAGEEDWIQIVSRVSGIHFRPAPTNKPPVRMEALRLPMTRLIDGRTPGLLIDPSCTLTARALTSEYQWVVTAGRRSTEPLKNWASHLVEAHQYALLDGGHYHQVMARQQQLSGRTGPILAGTDFNVFAR